MTRYRTIFIPADDSCFMYEHLIDPEQTDQPELNSMVKSETVAILPVYDKEELFRARMLPIRVAVSLDGLSPDSERQLNVRAIALANAPKMLRGDAVLVGWDPRREQLASLPDWVDGEIVASVVALWSIRFLTTMISDTDDDTPLDYGSN